MPSLREYFLLLPAKQKTQELIQVAMHKLFDTARKLEIMDEYGRTGLLLHKFFFTKTLG